MKVELFYADGCQRCAASRDSLRAAVKGADPGIEWRDIDAVKELDYAVQLGVGTLPAVAIEGKLVFSSLPSPEQLRKAVLARRVEGGDGR